MTTVPPTVPDAQIDQHERRTRALAANDPHRPIFHVTAPEGWLNDPNGVGERDGVHHLFYQANPHAAVHARIHWGHVVSDDLVSWRDEPIALVPGHEGPDREGCWSGVMLDDAGIPVLMYTGLGEGDRQTPCLAVGDSEARRFDTLGPVIDAPISDAVTGFRDHCVWRDDAGTWWQVIGSGRKDLGGTLELYSSADLRSWEHHGQLLADTGHETAEPWMGTLWECPDLFEIDGHLVFTFSAWHEGETLYTVVRTGRWVIPAEHGDADGPGVPAVEFGAPDLLDDGGVFFYAPQSYRDAAGRRIMWGWMQEDRPDAVCMEAGWSGAMSVPRLASWADGRVHLEPVPELARLRTESLDLLTMGGADADGPAGDVALEADPAWGDVCDFELEVDLGEEGVLDVWLRWDRETGERTLLRIDRGAGYVTLDRTHSSNDPRLAPQELSGPLLEPVDGGPTQVRVLVDRSALEVFVNGRPIGARVYPIGAARGFAAHTRGGAAVRGATAHRMGPIFGT